MKGMTIGINKSGQAIRDIPVSGWTKKAQKAYNKENQKRWRDKNPEKSLKNNTLWHAKQKCERLLSNLVDEKDAGKYNLNVHELAITFIHLMEADEDKATVFFEEQELEIYLNSIENYVNNNKDRSSEGHDVSSKIQAHGSNLQDEEE